MLHHALSLFQFASDTCSNGIIGPGSPGLYDHLCSGTDVQITALTDTIVLVANVIAILLWLTGALGVLFLILGGLYYVTSAGDPSRLKRAKEILVNVVVGMVIVISAYAIISFITSKLH